MIEQLDRRAAFPVVDVDCTVIAATDDNAATFPKLNLFRCDLHKGVIREIHSRTSNMVDIV